MLEIQRRGASAAKLRGKEWMQIEWRFEQPSFQSVDETKDNEIQKMKVQMELSLHPHGCALSGCNMLN